MCDGCSRPFADQQAYHSALTFDEGAYVRRDYCETCWDGMPEDVPSEGIWRGVFRLPPPPPEEPLKRETAESLLRRLMEDEDESRGNVIFILAVMLERKRMLIERDVQQRGDGVTIRIYEHRRTGETFVVPDPGLALDQLEDVQQEVIDLLGVGKTQDGGPSSEDGGQKTDEGEP